MPASRTEQIVLAVIAALKAAGLPSGVTVDRNQQKPLTLDELPRISVYQFKEQISRANSNRMTTVSDRNLRILVVARVAGTQEALDPLRQWIVSSLLASPGSSSWYLGGLALAIDEDDVDWDFDEDSESDYSVAATMFVIRYVTRKNDLTQ